MGFDEDKSLKLSRLFNMTTITPPTTSYKPLSELTLSLPNTLSFKAFTSHGRDVAFHSYANEPPLFTIEVPDSYPSPVRLLLRSPEKATLANCEPAHTPGSRPERWELVIPSETYQHMGTEGKGKVTGEIQQLNAESRTVMEKIGKDTYQVAALWLTQSHYQTSAPKMPLQTTYRWQKQEQQSAASTTFSNPDWKLTNPTTGEVHAVFFERWSATERGQMQFRRSFGREWELTVVLSVGMIVEEGRRRKRTRGNFAMGFAKGHGGASF
ncbi:uncharacterized protein LY89DRAFT_722180 [Mollisia scopiformis]|uniref:Uncharacterized protein n=1 Tax=Mollisia scopiformis TaxID=149040 RepID=A0A194WXA7_MOLSC|nr:uncharacterized protein LY89DRAFT_722180 [Mollisia scopiformis]KUJ12613.1 hypothetical protein LY89DRAFT_722180 [Mollisia scopiformis]